MNFESTVENRIFFYKLIVYYESTFENISLLKSTIMEKEMKI